METRRILIEMAEEDCQWLEETYGKSWIMRLEQHIKHEIMLRRRDNSKLKLRKPWDY
jgi:hypothetical protein